MRTETDSWASPPRPARIASRRSFPTGASPRTDLGWDQETSGPHDGVALGVGAQSSEERHAGRFQLALGETGTGGGDAGPRVHLVRAHCGSGIGIRGDHLDAAALLAKGLNLAFQIRARESAQTL